MDSLRRHGLGWLVAGSFLMSSAAWHFLALMEGRFAGLGLHLFMSAEWLGGGVIFGRGCVLLRRAKASAPDVTWFVFFRDDLLAFILIASLGGTYYILPQSVQDSLMRAFHELE